MATRRSFDAALAVLALGALLALPAPGTPARADSRDSGLRELRSCLRLDGRERADCLQRLLDRLKSGQTDRRGFYSGLSRGFPCDAGASTADVLTWFYGPELGDAWVPESEGFLLGCLSTEGRAQAWPYIRAAFDRPETAARLSADHWSAIQRICVSGNRADCLQWVGTEAFDGAFGGKEREAAYISAVARAASASRDADLLVEAGQASCRLGGPRDPSLERLRSWRLGYLLRCDGSSGLSALVGQVLGDARASDTEVEGALQALCSKPALRAEPTIRAALSRCASLGGEGSTRAHLCESPCPGGGS